MNQKYFKNYLGAGSLELMERGEMSAMLTLGLSVEVLLRVTNLIKRPLPRTSFDVVIRKKKNTNWRK